MRLALLVVSITSLLSTKAVASVKECELYATLAYDAKLMLKNGYNEDELIDWGLKVLDENEFGKNTEQAFITIMTSIVLRGSPKQVADFIFETCIDDN
jgi:hypothetical protein